LRGLHLGKEIAKQFSRGLDDAQWSAEFMGNHGNEIALELAEFFFAFKSLEQLLLRAFSLGYVQGQREDMRLVANRDRFGRKQNREPITGAITPSTLSLPNRACSSQ